MTTEPRSRLISSLLRPSAYPHATTEIRLLETHISWVLLTGDYAYKIKKPVDFGFVDFSTLERRRFFCEEELRLNRRFAPALYLRVVPLAGANDDARIEGQGAPIEYAVKMRQFRQDHIFQTMLAHGFLQRTHVEGIAERIAAFHAATRRAGPADPWGTPRAIHAVTEENFQTLLQAATAARERLQLQRLRDWNQEHWAKLRDFMEERRHTGFVRECHGDLHLGNLVLIDEVPTAFDCIEFNETLRWIDVASEIAFLCMDLEVQSASHLAYRFLNRYETISGDYAGLRLWDFYRLYRAMVRAKVARLTLHNTSDHDRQCALRRDCQRYLDYGSKLIRPKRPRLILTHGLSGSGKSYIASALSSALPAVWLRSDIERKRIMAFDAATRYRPEATRKTYTRLRDLAAKLLAAGLSVIVDATFLRRWQREQQRTLANESGAAFSIVEVVTPPHVLEERIEHRRLFDRDPSEATREVLKRQRDSFDPLSDEERREIVKVDGQRPDLPTLIAAIESRAASPAE